MALYISFLLNCFRKNDEVLNVLHEMSVDCGPLPSPFSSEWISQTFLLVVLALEEILGNYVSTLIDRVCSSPLFCPSLMFFLIPVYN